MTEGGTFFLCTIHKNSNTGRSEVQAFTWELALSNSWNFDNRMGINVAGHRVLASKIAFRTRGGTIRLFFPWKTGGLWSGTISTATLSTNAAVFKSCQTGTGISKSKEALVGSMRWTVASAKPPDKPSNFESEQNRFSWRKLTWWSRIRLSVNEKQWKTRIFFQIWNPIFLGLITG
jgi:hypothetical protein